MPNATYELMTISYELHNTCYGEINVQYIFIIMLIACKAVNFIICITVGRYVIVLLFILAVCAFQFSAAIKGLGLSVMLERYFSKLFYRVSNPKPTYQTHLAELCALDKPCLSAYYNSFCYRAVTMLVCHTGSRVRFLKEIFVWFTYSILVRLCVICGCLCVSLVRGCVCVILFILYYNCRYLQCYCDKKPISHIKHNRYNVSRKS